MPAEVEEAEEPYYEPTAATLSPGTAGTQADVRPWSDHQRTTTKPKKKAPWPPGPKKRMK